MPECSLGRTQRPQASDSEMGRPDNGGGRMIHFTDNIVTPCYNALYYDSTGNGKITPAN